MRRLRHPPSADFRGDGLAAAISPFDVYEGTEGDDTYTGTKRDDTINGYGGDDTLSGGKGNDLIDGGEGDDTLAGNKGNDILRGGAGDDTIMSSSGADTVDGGEGLDKWIGSYTTATGSLTFDQRNGTLSNGTTLTGIEFVQLTTGSGADQFTMNGDQPFSIDAGGGSDTFEFDPSSSDHANAPLTIAIETNADGFQVTLQDGDIYNVASSFERLNLVGGGADDVFNLHFETYNTRLSVLLDGGSGNDHLTWDLSGQLSSTFIVDEEGVVHFGFVTIENVEDYTLVFGTGENKVMMGEGDDSIISHGSKDKIDGGGGDDYIEEFGTGFKRTQAKISGGDGNDQIYSYQKYSVISGDSGDDLIFTFGAHMIIDGGDGLDQWQTNLQRDLIYHQDSGTLSNDIRIINIEKTIMFSSARGEGSTFYLDMSSEVEIVSHNQDDKIFIDVSKKEDGVVASSGLDEAGNAYLLSDGISLLAYNLNHDFADLSFIGTNFSDLFSISHVQVARAFMLIDGGGGSDSLTLSQFSDVELVVDDAGKIKSSFAEILNFEQFMIIDLGGRNTIVLGSGDDVVSMIASAVGPNDLSGGGGADQITAAKGADRLSGGDGDDVLSGGGGGDVLTGDAGTDLIDGGAGIDTAGYYTATAGVTVALVADAQDTGGAGVDTLVSIENLNGSTFNDTLTGDDGANTLRGREGNDVLAGGGGADRLDGGAGADRMTGGSGADTFVFVRLDDISSGVRDQVVDFSHADGDTIDLSAIDLSPDPGDQRFTFIGTAAFTGADDIFELRIREQPNGYIIVQGDLDHDAKPDFTFAVFTGGELMVAADFVL